MLTGKQRAQLRALSNPMSPIFQVGKGGVSEEMCRQISNALEARELIKLNTLDSFGCTAREAAEEIAAATGADVVAVLGKKFVLYRESETLKAENKNRILL